MLFLVLLAVGAATAGPVPNIYIVTEPTAFGNYLMVEPLPEAPVIPPLHFGTANEHKKSLEVVPAERAALEEDIADNVKSVEFDGLKPVELNADDAIPSEDDPNIAKPEEDNDNDRKFEDDEANNAKPNEDDANDAKPDESEHHEESETVKPIPLDVIKIPSPSDKEKGPLLIRVEDAKPPGVSWLPSFIPAFDFPSLSNIPLLSGLPSISNFDLSSFNLPSISNFNLSNLSNFNIPGLSSIFGSSPTGSRYIVYGSY